MRFGASVIIGSLALSCSLAAGDVVNIGVGNTYYEPQYPVVDPGDTIHWFREGGNHDVTSGNPCLDEDGLFYAPITAANPTFDFGVPDLGGPGAIVYYCGVGGHCISGDQFGALLVQTGPAHIVETNGYAFDPANVNVQPGDVVMWNNTGGTHDVVFGTDCMASGEFSEPLTPTSPLAFYIVPGDHPGGVIDYFCTPHCGWGMTGTITIEGAGNDCPADVDGSGVVSVDDLLAVIASYNSTCDCAEDINDDGVVNVEDILEVLAAYGDVC